MKTRRALTLTGLLIFILFLVVKLPASVVYPLIKDSIKGPDLAGLKGTIWSGQATSIELMNQRFQNIYWEFHPLALLTGNVGIDIDIRDPQYPLQAAVSTGLGGDELEAKQIKGALPAAILQQIPALALLRLSGVLHINIRHLLLVDNEPRAAAGEILLSEGHLQQPVKTLLGNILLTASQQEEQILVKIKDQQAPISIDGTLNLQAGRKFNFSAKLKPGSKANNMLVGMLRNFARMEADGSMKIQYQGIY